MEKSYLTSWEKVVASITHYFELIDIGFIWPCYK